MNPLDSAKRKINYSKKKIYFKCRNIYLQKEKKILLLEIHKVIYFGGNV